MPTEPLVSIITATYNAEAHLQSSILSVLDQTYPHYEYIIIDGASTDRTPDIIKQNGSHITYWVSEKDSGIYEAWNKGLMRAKGEWILFIGADDQLLPDALNNYVDFINSNSHIDFEYISSKVQRINLDGTADILIGKSWKWNEFKRRMTTAHPGSLHSRNLFNTYGFYDTRYRVVSDYELLLRPREKLVAGFLDETTVLMSTGGRFSAKITTIECLKMFKNTAHLKGYRYYTHKVDILIRMYIKNLLSLLR